MKKPPRLSRINANGRDGWSSFLVGEDGYQTRPRHGEEKVVLPEN